MTTDNVPQTLATVMQDAIADLGLSDPPEDLADLERTVRELTGSKRLLSGPTARETLRGLLAFELLHSQPWVWHGPDGRSWLIERDGEGVTEAGNRYTSGRREIGEAHGYPTDHPMGDCFECSGVEPPEGYSIEARRASQPSWANAPAKNPLRGKQLSDARLRERGRDA